MIEKIVAFLSVSFDPNQLRASSFFGDHQARLLKISDANERVAYIFHAVRTKGYGIDLDRISLTNLMKRVHRVASYMYNSLVLLLFWKTISNKVSGECIQNLLNPTQTTILEERLLSQTQKTFLGATPEGEIPKKKAVVQGKKIEWTQLVAKTGEYGFRSFTRQVYCTEKMPSGTPKIFSSGCVIKVSGPSDRRNKLHMRLWPYGEEIVYKVAKALGWNSEFPKTKTLPSEYLHQEKYAYYQSLIRSAGFEELPGGFTPSTYTVQVFKKGKSLPEGFKGELEKTGKLDVISFQRAYLLNWMMGRLDARSDNTLWDPETGHIFEIDNEMLGGGGYDKDGILRHFTNQLNAVLEESVCEQFLAYKAEKLEKIREKYIPKDQALYAIWGVDVHVPDSGKKRYGESFTKILNLRWDGIKRRFEWMQNAMQRAKESGDQITIAMLEEMYEKERIKITPPKASS